MWEKEVTNKLGWRWGWNEPRVLRVGDIGMNSFNMSRYRNIGICADADMWYVS